MNKPLLGLLALGLTLLIFLLFFQAQGADVKNEQKYDSTQINWIWNDIPKSIQIAKVENKFVLIDFWASWCHWCMKMDEEVLSDKEVVEFVSANFVPVKIDADLEQSARLLRFYGVYGTPAFVVLDKNGMVLAQTVGYKPKDEFLKFLEPYEKSAGG